jgi:hypothetical protein
MSNSYKLSTDNDKGNASAPRKAEMKVNNEDLLKIYNDKANFYQEVHIVAAASYVKFRAITNSELFAIICFLILKLNYPKRIVFGFFEQLSLGGKTITNNSIFILREKLLMNRANVHKLNYDFRLALIKKTWNNYVLGKEVKILKYDQEREGSIQFIPFSDLKNHMFLID